MCWPEGSALEALAEAGIKDVPVHRIGMPDSFIKHGTAADQRRQLQLDAEGIAQRVLVFFPEAAAPSNRRGRPGNGGKGVAGGLPCRNHHLVDSSAYTWSGNV